MTSIPTELKWWTSTQARWLWLITALALLLRLVGIKYGLPHVYWTDEYHEVMRAMELGAGGFNLARTGKGGFYLLLFVEYGFYFVVLKLTGVVSSTQEFAELFVSDPTTFYLLGRITAAFFGVATVVAVYLLARSAYRDGAAVVSALFLSVNVLHADLSHRVGVDVPMALFATLALYSGVRIAVAGLRKDYILAATFAGLATTTKLPGILVLVPLLIAHGYSVGGSPGAIRRWVSSPNIWIAFVIFLMIWVVTNPGIIFASNYFSLFSAPADEASGEIATGAVRPILWIFYLDVLRESMGWPLFVLSLASVGYGIWKRRPADVLLVTYGLANFAAISSTSSKFLYFPRYTLPIVVVLSVLSGRAVYDLCSFVRTRRVATTGLLVSVLIAAPLLRSTVSSYTLTKTDTRTLAKEWFETHAPVDSKVLIEGAKTSASRLTVPLYDSREALDQRIAYWSVIEPRQAKYLEIKRASHAGGGYRLELINLNSVASLETYIHRDVEYFVVRPSSFLASRKAGSGSATLVRRLRTDPNVKLLKRIDASSTLRPGPEIEIFQWSPRSNAGGIE